MVQVACARSGPLLFRNFVGNLRSWIGPSFSSNGILFTAHLDQLGCVMKEWPLKNADVVEMYRTMLKIRRFEEKVHDFNEKGLLSWTKNAIHLYIGQEAVAVGVCSALKKDDYITSTHRGHGHVIAKGGRLDKTMAEIFGKETGYCKGKGGSMHIADINLGILGANGIVGAGIPQAVGAGLSSKLRHTGNVCASFFGDGASNGGAFHEALNLAAVWKLPVVFVCEHNSYAISTSASTSTSVKNIADRAAAYNMPGMTVDGMDVMAVFEAASKAVDRARKGDGPTLLECKTYRYMGHFEGDPFHYRTKEEVAQWMERDPIKKLRKKLVDTKTLTDAEADKIEQGVIAEVENAAKFAFDSPFPSPETATEGVFAE
jgi:pyruvate dehydrogenase E1 component alpha subunit